MPTDPLPSDPAPLGAVEVFDNVFATEGRRVRFRAGAYLLRQGDPSGAVLLVRSGIVKIVTVSASGRESVLGVRGSGTSLGELSVVLDQRRNADAIAIGPVVADSIVAARFGELLATNHQFTLAMLRTVAERMAEASMHQHRLATFDGLARVSAALVDLGGRVGIASGSSIMISTRFSQQDLAGLTGMSRDSVVRALRTLRESGWIETRRQAVVIHDIDALMEIGGA